MFTKSQLQWLYFILLSLSLTSVAAIFQTDCYYHSHIYTQVTWGDETVELDPTQPGKPVTASNKYVYSERQYVESATDFIVFLLLNNL